MGGWCGGGFARKRGLKGDCAVAQVGRITRVNLESVVAS